MKRLIILFNIILITGISYFSVKSFYDSVGARIDVSPIPRMADAPALAQGNEQKRDAVHYQSIENRNLFRTQNLTLAEAAKKAQEALTIEEPLKKTELKLRLWGTITGDKLYSRAILEDPTTKKQILLKEGESVQDARIKEIHWNEVILSVNGKDEVLEIEKPGAMKKDGKQLPTPPVPGAEDPNAVRGDSGVRNENIAVARSEIDSASQNINDIMRQARFRPHYVDGKPQGLTVTSIKPDSIFTKLGLQSGDIIMGIDGQEIKTVDDALKFYTGLKSSSNVSLKIKRRGLEKNLDYNIE